MVSRLIASDIYDEHFKMIINCTLIIMSFTVQTLQAFIEGSLGLTGLQPSVAVTARP